MCSLTLDMPTPLISTSNGSPASGDHQCNDELSSIHSAQINEIYDIPMEDIHRPFPSFLDENKVQSIIDTIQVYDSCINKRCQNKCILDVR
jgi:uncharacterized protein YfbU (UPF0304 family)